MTWKNSALKCGQFYFLPECVYSAVSFFVLGAEVPDWACSSLMLYVGCWLEPFEKEQGKKMTSAP